VGPNHLINDAIRVLGHANVANRDVNGSTRTLHLPGGGIERRRLAAVHDDHRTCIGEELSDCEADPAA
jgi:hypothetical protein